MAKGRYIQTLAGNDGGNKHFVPATAQVFYLLITGTLLYIAMQAGTENTQLPGNGQPFLNLFTTVNKDYGLIDSFGL